MNDTHRPGDVIEQLERAARKRWGEAWSIHQLHFSDGTTQEYAYRNHGKTDEGLLEKERLFVGLDGEIYHDHVLVDKETIVDVLESDEAPEEIRGEIVHGDSG